MSPCKSAVSDRAPVDRVERHDDNPCDHKTAVVRCWDCWQDGMSTDSTHLPGLNKYINTHLVMFQIQNARLMISNETSINSPGSEAQAQVCLPVRAPDECYYNTLLCCDYLSSSSVVSCVFSVLCVYSKFRHHPHPLGYHCAKFSFFRGLHC